MFLVLVLDARGSGVLQLLELGDGIADVAHQHVGHVARHALAHHDAHYDHVLDVLGHRIGGNHPAALLQFGLQVEQRPLGLLVVLGIHHPDEQRVDDLLRIVLEAFHRADLLVAVLGDVHRVLLDLLVSLESQADEVVVLAEYLRCGAREVEADLRDVGAQVVDRERHFVGQVFLVFPYHPSQAGIYQAVLVARRGDRQYPLEAEVPLLLGFEERQDETARRCVDVDRDFIAGLGVVLVERLVQPLDVVVQARPRDACDRHDADRVLVAHLQRLLGVERDVVERQGHGAHFDLPQLAELLPYDLEPGAHHQVRFVEGLACGLAALAPAEPCGHAAQHTCLRRTDAQRTGLPFGLLGGVPHVGDDVQAAAAHHRDTRVLRFVDVVDVDGLVHQPCGVIVHVGRYERGEVQPRLCLRIGLVLD